MGLLACLREVSRPRRAPSFGARHGSSDPSFTFLSQLASDLCSASHLPNPLFSVRNIVSARSLRAAYSSLILVHRHPAAAP